MNFSAGKLSGLMPVAAALILVLAAVLLRVWDWPARYEVRDVDEAGYLDSSLVLVEGITPGYKPSPAGPQIWLGWAWAQIETAWNVVHPDSPSLKVPLKIRPFVAMDLSLFSLYRDMSAMRQLVVAVNVVLLALAVIAGVGYGRLCGGVIGGVLVGGLLAVSPIFVEYSMMARPYSMAWSFGVLSVYAVAARRGRWRISVAGILLGLAIGSRIEMILLMPLLLWELWDSPPAGAGRLKSSLQLIGTSLLTAYVVAPWLLTGLPGNLRAIGTIQIANPDAAAVTARSIFADFAWTNGFGLAALLFVVGIPFVLSGANRLPFAVLILLVLLITATIFKSTGFGLHHSGAALVVLVLGCARAATALHQRWPRFAWIALSAVLLLPAVQSIRGIAAKRGGIVTSSADWIESHVPAGTVVYIVPWLLKAPLPTAHAADLIWDDVTNSQAWRRKIESGMKRFGVAIDQLPRAMSEENLVQERGSARRWFILGSQANEPAPRYELRLIQSSPVFGVQNVGRAFSQSGGVVLWPGSDAPPELGKPVMKLSGVDGGDVLVFCSPDVHLAATRP